jgi:hypothetical protein
MFSKELSRNTLIAPFTTFPAESKRNLIMAMRWTGAEMKMAQKAAAIGNQDLARYFQKSAQRRAIGLFVGRNATQITRRMISQQLGTLNREQEAAFQDIVSHQYNRWGDKIAISVNETEDDVEVFFADTSHLDYHSATNKLWDSLVYLIGSGDAASLRGWADFFETNLNEYLSTEMVAEAAGKAIFNYKSRGVPATAGLREDPGHGRAYNPYDPDARNEVVFEALKDLSPGTAVALLDPERGAIRWATDLADPDKADRVHFPLSPVPFKSRSLRHLAYVDTLIVRGVMRDMRDAMRDKEPADLADYQRFWEDEVFPRFARELQKYEKFGVDRNKVIDVLTLSPAGKYMVSEDMIEAAMNGHMYSFEEAFPAQYEILYEAMTFNDRRKAQLDAAVKWR